MTPSIRFTVGDRWFHDANALTLARQRRPELPPPDLDVLRAPIDLLIEGRGVTGPMPDEPLLAFLESLVRSAETIAPSSGRVAEVALDESPWRLALTCLPSQAAELAVFRVTRGGEVAAAIELATLREWQRAVAATIVPLLGLAERLDPGPVRDAVGAVFAQLVRRANAAVPASRAIAGPPARRRAPCTVETQGADGLTLITTLEHPGLLLDYPGSDAASDARTLLVPGSLSVLPDAQPGVRIDGFPLAMFAGLVADHALGRERPELHGRGARLTFDRLDAAVTVELSTGRWRWPCDVRDVFELFVDHAQRVIEVLISGNPQLRSHRSLLAVLERGPTPARPGPTRRAPDASGAAAPQLSTDPGPDIALRRLTFRPAWRHPLRGTRSASALIAHSGAFAFVQQGVLWVARPERETASLAIRAEPAGGGVVVARAGDLIWATSSEGGVVAVDTSEVEQAVRCALRGRVEAIWPVPGSDDALVLAGETLHRVSIDGVIWSAGVDAHRGQCFVTPGSLAFVAPDGSVHTLDPRDGRLVAIAAFPPEMARVFGCGQTLVAAGLADDGGVALAALDVAEGRLVSRLALGPDTRLLVPRFRRAGGWLPVATRSRSALVRYDVGAGRFERLTGPSIDPMLSAVWADADRVVLQGARDLICLAPTGSEATRAWTQQSATARPWYTVAEPVRTVPETLVFGDGGDILWVALGTGRRVAELQGVHDGWRMASIVVGEDDSVLAQFTDEGRPELRAWTRAGFLGVVDRSGAGRRRG